MKTIVFVCILSLSMCFGALPTSDQTSATKGQEAAVAGSPVLKKDEIITPNNKTHEPLNSTVPKNDTKDPETTTKEDQSKVTDKGTGNSSHETGTTDNQQPNNKTTSQASTETQKNTPVTPAANVTNSTSGKPNNTTVPANDDKKKVDNATTTIQPIVSSTVAPAVTEKPAQLARGFDGASFVGGIILTLGLLAIGFMGFKYYKNQTERNYHTL